MASLRQGKGKGLGQGYGGHAQCCLLLPTGNLLGETLVGGLELGGDVLQQLVVLPNGCVEQNIFRVTPNILLTHYLDAMRQWHRIGVDHRDCTIQHILHGVQ